MAKTNWSTEVSAIDKILTELLGPATTSAASAPAGATGTAGKTTATSLTLDETTKIEIDGGSHARHRFRGVDVWRRAGSTEDG